MGRDRRLNVVILGCLICWWKSGEVRRWERWEGSEVARWRRWESGEVGRWEVLGFVQGWGMQGKSKISSFSF